MSYPILYSADEISFDHNGLGILSACFSCTVTEDENGMFELSMSYPMDGIHFEDIVDKAIIKAKSNPFSTPQLFRVYSISKPMSGVVKVSAEHISYDLSGIPVRPFSAAGAQAALSGLQNNSVVDCPFSFWTDIQDDSVFSVTIPASIRSRLLGVEESILSKYGGEFEFDNYLVKLHKNRGENRGVVLKYGKNLTDVRQDQNCSSVYTGVYPFWEGEVRGERVFVDLPERVINAPGTYNFVRIYTLDLSAEFEKQPTEEQIRQKTQEYIDENEIGVPVVSLIVSFAQLEKNDEYKHLNLQERVSLFDTITVEFLALGVCASAKVVSLMYDVLTDRILSIMLGSVRQNIATTVAKQQGEIKRAPTKSDIKIAQNTATDWLTSGTGYKVERRDSNGNAIDTLYLDQPGIDSAVNVMRLSQFGIDVSNGGVNGQYRSVLNINGDANFPVLNGKAVSWQDIGGITVLAAIEE